MEYDSDTDAAAPAPPAPSLATAATTGQLRAALAHLDARDAALTTHLNGLLATQPALTHTLTRLDLIRAHLATQVLAARTLTHSLLSPAAATATRVSSAVRRLDTEQGRVKATLAVVDHVAELKSCVLGVTGAMGAPQDWETAAGYLHRASRIPREIVTGAFAEEMVPSAEVPDPPAVTLEAAAESLCGLFLREFERAASVGDGEKLTRFFKLFPLIGRTEVGLDVYGRYVCQGVAARAREAMRAREGEGDLFYAGVMSRLFEHIASIVEQHSGLVERHYGEGRMLRVIERLQVEADTQGGIVVDTWGDERAIDRKLTDIKTYAFSFLVQSFLPQSRAAINGTPRSASPAPGGAAPRMSEDEGVDVKEIDKLLTEVSIMLSRWSLYMRFIALKLLPAPTTDADVSPTTLTPPPVLTSSALATKIAARLTAPYTTMTTFFLRRSIEKAFQLDEPPADLTLSAPPHTTPAISSAVDDVMYIIKTHLTRTLHTSSRALALGVVATVSRVLGADFVGMVQRRMQADAYPRGSPPGEEKVLAFCVLLNNLDVAREYVSRVVEGCGAGTALEEGFPFEGDAAAVREALRGVEVTFEGKSGELVADGVMVLFNQVVKPRLRPLLTEVFMGVEYVLSGDEEAGGQHEEEEEEEEEGGEVVRGRFGRGWEALVRGFRWVLTEKVFARLVGVTAAYLARLLEKRIWGYSGRVNELGAIRLERDVAGVVGVVVRGGLYGVREQFARCVQICLVVNMEEDEVAEMLSGEGGVEWKLEVEERRRARGMVVGGR